MTVPEGNDTRRISVDLPNQLIERFDELKREWGLRARGAVLKRLLEELLSDDKDECDTEFGHDNSISNSDINTSIVKPIEHTIKQKRPIYDETSALVLISNSEIIHKDNADLFNSENTSTKSQNLKASRSSGIDLPGFVRKNTNNLKASLQKNKSTVNPEETVHVTIPSEHLVAGLNSAKNHWKSLYGQSPTETVVEASMIWIARDIWPKLDNTEEEVFTWTAANIKVQYFCDSWIQKQPSFERVMVIVGVLEDPYGAQNLPERMPSLIRRFVNKFKKSQNVTSFQTIESTMTVHGALKLLGLPTQAGSALTLKSIKEAYKSKAMENHPDAGGSTETMRKLNEGYQLLKDLYKNK